MSKPSKKSRPEEAPPAEIEQFAAGALTHPRTGLPTNLKEAVKMIIRLVHPQKIFWMGTYENELEGKTYNEILLVLPRQLFRPHKEYATLVEHISLTVSPLSATILKNGDYTKLLSAGHIHFTRFCRMENLLYTADNLGVPKPGFLCVEEISKQAAARFDNRFSHSKAFLEGAQFYVARKYRAMSAFMLQQAVELAYRAITLGLTDHELLSNQLRAHLVKACRCAPEIHAAFSPANEEDVRLLQLLETAYVQGRYKARFRVSESDLRLLLDKTERLHRLAEKAFAEHLEAIVTVLRQL